MGNALQVIIFKEWHKVYHHNSIITKKVDKKTHLKCTMQYLHRQVKGTPKGNLNTLFLPQPQNVNTNL